MKRDDPVLRNLSVPALLLGAALAAEPAFGQTTVVFSDNFDTDPINADPTSDFTGNLVEDWSVDEDDFRSFGAGFEDDFTNAVVTPGVDGNTSNALKMLDQTFGDVLATVQTTQFAPFQVSDSSATPYMRVNFDINVQSLSVGNQFGVRFELRRTEGSNGTGFSYFGFGFQANDLFQSAPTDIDGDGGQDLFFGYYSSTSGSAITDPVGFDEQTDQWWHDFGNFDYGSVIPTQGSNHSDVPENNNSDGWVNVDLLFDAITDSVIGTLTLGADQTTFTAVLPGSVNFSSDGGDSLGTFRFRTGNTLETVFFIDNFTVTAEAIPEPSTLAIVGLTAACVLARRGRARSSRCAT